jgi:hypothetical protein
MQLDTRVVVPRGRSRAAAFAWMERPRRIVRAAPIASMQQRSGRAGLLPHDAKNRSGCS